MLAKFASGPATLRSSFPAIRIWQWRQNLALFPYMSTRENLAFPPVAHRADPKHISAKAAQVAETFHNHLLDKRPTHLLAASASA
jgi:ABC-type sugar transport system ATPase subunit